MAQGARKTPVGRKTMKKEAMISPLIMIVYFDVFLLRKENSHEKY